MNAPVRVLTASLLLLVSLLAPVPGPASAAGGAPPRGERYLPPVDAPITERFRLPEEDWHAGNRGLKYGTRPGQTVRAIGAGTVTFAGQVGGSLHVTITHRDGLRSSYSFVAAIRVQEGDRPRTGDPIAVAGDGFHLGIRRGDRYLDPETILGTVIDPGRIRLVPVDGSAPVPTSPPSRPTATPTASTKALADGLSRVRAVVAGHWSTNRHGG